MAPKSAFIGRAAELESLQRFVAADGSGFVHLRGRRRIGKSWLLTELRDRVGGVYFQGEMDATTKELQATLAALWDADVGKEHLSLIRRRDLTWERIFEAITDHALANPADSVLLMFDEIHWIAKRNSGFVSKLKRAWLAWEKTRNIKVIICGSSNRFFEQKTGRQSSVLRGLRTQADIWVKPFSLADVRRYFLPASWSQEEVCLTYMMIGGVPYYLNQIPDDRNFIRAINEAFFTSSTIFLDELDEVINLEFNRTSKPRVRQILSSLGQSGRTAAAVSGVTGIAESSVRETLDKLLDFGLVFERTRLGDPPKKNRAGTRYYMRDFYLNFYFQVLEGVRRRVRRNKRENIFATLIASKSGYFIPSLSGGAFELLIESIIDCRANDSLEEPLFTKLRLSEPGFHCGHYWEHGKTQVDLVVVCPADRESRVVEAKWLANRAALSTGYVDQVCEKAYPPPRGYRLSFFLAMSKSPTRGLQRAADNANVCIIGLADLF